ncbi:DUF551 domain-containing protein [Cronobacter sakazakii]|nr:DUF551 domain-containing protein [Cronobacter sakazakii]
MFTVNPITPHADPRRVIKLYAEPPAPVAPAVRAEPVAGENLPCPFCGGACDPAGWLSEQTSGPECENCGATAENIEAWNRRTAPPAPPAPPAPVAAGWIACSERLPEVGDIVLTADNGCVNVGEMERSGASYGYFTSVVSGRELPATHWMPLPEAPGKEG